MAPHDPLFKSLLRTFFASFLRLVAPDLAARLDLASVAYLDKEFIAAPDLERSRVVDLLARIALKGEPWKSLMVHVEIEARARRGMGIRLRDYHRAIQAWHEDQVLSIVVYLKGGPAGIREQVLDGGLQAPGLTSFRYLSFSLSRCSATEYLAKPEPLAWALAARMDRGDRSKAELKMSCLTKIAEAPLSESERFELANCVETYLQLAPEETAEFFFLGTSETRRARTMLYRMSWADQMKRDGALVILQDLMEERFGSIPEDIKLRLGRIRSIERLSRLSRKVLKAKSFQDLGLG
jgi:hypothetical protein